MRRGKRGKEENKERKINYAVTREGQRDVRLKDRKGNKS